MKEQSGVLGMNLFMKSISKNLGLSKNYIGSFSYTVDENIPGKTQQAGMVFSSNFGRRNVNPSIYIKF